MATTMQALSLAQKAAAVLLAIPSETAAKVLRHLPDVDMERVTLEIATLGQIQPGQLDTILQDFRSEALARRHLISGGEQHARDMLRALHGTDADEVIDRLLAAVQTTPFHFLRLHEAREIVQHLRDEHPQTVALVLAHLPARFAARVLSGFPSEVQSDISRRVALLDGVSPEVVAQVEEELRRRLGGVQRRGDTGRGGVKELADILNQTDRTTERTILGELETSDPELAEEIRSLMFVFDDIGELDDRTIQTILPQVDIKMLALALKGAADSLTAAITNNLSERGRQTLTEEIDLLGQVRVRDVETAQTEVVRVVRELEDAGTIVLGRSGEGEFIG